MERKYLTISPHFHMSFQMPYAFWHLLALHTPGSENRTVVNGKACRTPRIYSSADALRMEPQLQKPHFHKSPAWKLDSCKTATANSHAAALLIKCSDRPPPQGALYWSVRSISWVAGRCSHLDNWNYYLVCVCLLLRLVHRSRYD